MRMLRWFYPYPLDTYAISVTIDGLTETLSVDMSGRDSWAGYRNFGPNAVSQLFAALATHTNWSTGTITVNADGTLRYAFSGVTSVSLIWGGLTTLPAEQFGFVSGETYASTNDGGQQVINTPFPGGGTWLPGRPASVDSRDRQRVVGGARSAISGLTRVTTFGIQAATRSLQWQLVPRDLVLQEFATWPVHTFEWAWLNAIGLGHEFDLYESETDLYQLGTYRLAQVVEAIERDARYPFRWQVTVNALQTAGDGSP